MRNKFFMIDNMDGNDDIDSIRTTVEEIIRKSFLQTEVPPSWLMFRILLILIGKPVVSLGLCRALANRLEMPTTCKVEDAIHFFHHNIGSLMYYPEVDSIKDVVICDPQVIFDSISELVIDTFGVANRAIPRSVRKEFESKGFFILKHIESTTQKKRKSHLTPKQLVDLLKHLGILAEIQPEPSSNSDESTKFIIPAVLKNASETELIPDSLYNHTYSIMVHFDLGFVPYGVFCFIIAYLINSQDKLTIPWELRKDLPIRKNCVVFLVDRRFDVVLISQPQYLEIQIGQYRTTRKKALSIEDICPIVREQLVQTLSNVIMEMKYKLSIFAPESEKQSYSMAFPCSKEGHSGHLMKIIEEKDQKPYAQCCKDGSEIDLLDHNQLIWFGGEKVPHDNGTVTTDQLVCTSNYSGALNIDHLDQVQLAIWEGRTEWRYLGLELQLSPETLKSIKRSHPQSVKDCFHEMLSEWLRSGQRSTWEDLISALRSPIVGLQSLASRLENKLGKVLCEDPKPANNLKLHTIKKDSGILNTNHLVHVLRAIWEARTEWKSLGLELCIASDTLETIDMDHHHSVKDCFLEMLFEWLKSGHRPNWETLISALRSPSVDLQSLVVKLALMKTNHE